MRLPLPPRLGIAFRVAIFCNGLLLAAAHPVGALDAGDAAPLFQAPRLSGSGSLSLADYRGKVVYLDFWASWCTPCLKALPALDRLRHEFASRDFEVVAVNVDRDPEAGRRFLRKLEVGYPSATDPKGTIPERFELGTMPTSFLIDRKGVIRHVHEGFRDGDVEALRERIAALVAEE